jgi:hypothetical protein
MQHIANIIIRKSVITYNEKKIDVKSDFILTIRVKTN